LTGGASRAYFSRVLGSARRKLMVAVGILLLGAVAVMLLASSGPYEAPGRSAGGGVRVDADPGTALTARDPGPIAGLPDAAPAPGSPVSRRESVASDAWQTDPLAGSDNGWASVDLEAVRAAMPDNIYWEMSAPTRDPDVLRQREETRRRWNDEYGKVLSNTATEQEIRAYYAHRDRLASDYVELITHLLENYGRSLSLRDVGLLKVAAELNLARLEEIPRQLAEALERRQAHEAARQAWLRDQAAFDGHDTATR
jgi:hypothetical protein